MAQSINSNPLSFETQIKKLLWWFWYSNHQIRAVGFESQPEKHVHLDFKSQLRNSRFSFPCVWYRPHTVSPDLPIVRPPSTRSVFDHLRSSTPGLLLLSRSSSLSVMSHMSPIHHEKNKHDSPHEIRIKVKLQKCPKFKFNPWHVNNSLHIKSMYLPLVVMSPYGASSQFSHPITPADCSTQGRSQVILSFLFN
jgi:hypothetical protein